MVICAVTMRVVESAAAADQLDMGCVDTPRNRRCFTLYKADSTWTEAAGGCGGVTGNSLAIIDHADVEQRLNAALEQQGRRSSNYMAWTAGRQLDQQLEWSWIDGHTLDGLLFELHSLNTRDAIETKQHSPRGGTFCSGGGISNFFQEFSRLVAKF